MTNSMNVSEVTGEVNYEETMKEFGIDVFPGMKRKNLPVLYRRNIVFGSRDFGQIADAIENKKQFAVLTGANPSGSLHLGNKMFLDQALFFQECGADVFIPISNDETYVFKKSESLEQATKNAIESVIPDIIALGFDRKKTHIFISTEYRKVYELSVKISTKATFSTVKAIFGFGNETNIGQLFYAVVQSGHILMPQYIKGKMPTVVPIGIDQDPYMRLSRDIAERAGFTKPSSTYHRFIPGLQGGKMSGSKPETCIYLNDSPDAAKKKIMRAFSGGASSLEEHRKHGGNPDIDVPFQYLYSMFEDDDKKIQDIRQKYSSGSMTSGEMKNYLADKVGKFLKQHQKAKEKAKKNIDKYMLTD